MKQKKDLFKKEPSNHDFPAALDYLALVLPPKIAEQKVEALKQAPTIIKKSKDIFRASALPLLPKDNIHVAADLKTVKEKKKLSPILLVRGSNEKLIIADGYHRMCAAYYLGENFEIPCRLV
jgi:hypothetical protein